jgi:hypothetical protein
MNRMVPALVVGLVLLAAGAAVAGGRAAPSAQGGGLPQGDERVTLDPADFTTRIDNPYFPLVPGSRWVLREGEQRITTSVLERTRTIAGVEARVVRDVARENGQPVEVTFDWYAQDRRGNVWYLGEATTDYENGRPSGTEGSWEHGVDGAQAGIIMPAEPREGQRYRQEYFEGEAEDRGEVLSVGERAEVPAGFYRDLVMTRDDTPLQPRAVEYKFYARGVGLVLVLNAGDNEELVRLRRGSGQR